MHWHAPLTAAIWRRLPAAPVFSSIPLLWTVFKIESEREGAIDPRSEGKHYYMIQVDEGAMWGSCKGTQHHSEGPGGQQANFRSRRRKTLFKCMCVCLCSSLLLWFGKLRRKRPSPLAPENDYYCKEIRWMAPHIWTRFAPPSDSSTVSFALSFDFNFPFAARGKSKNASHWLSCDHAHQQRVFDTITSRKCKGLVFAIHLLPRMGWDGGDRRE